MGVGVSKLEGGVFFSACRGLGPLHTIASLGQPSMDHRRRRRVFESSTYMYVWP